MGRKPRKYKEIEYTDEEKEVINILKRTHNTILDLLYESPVDDEGHVRTDEFGDPYEPFSTYTDEGEKIRNAIATSYDRPSGEMIDIMFDEDDSAILVVDNTWAVRHSTDKEKAEPREPDDVHRIPLDDPDLNPLYDLRELIRFGRYENTILDEERENKYPGVVFEYMEGMKNGTYLRIEAKLGDYQHKSEGIVSRRKKQQGKRMELTIQSYEDDYSWMIDIPDNSGKSLREYVQDFYGDSLAEEGTPLYWAQVNDYVERTRSDEGLGEGANWNSDDLNIRDFFTTIYTEDGYLPEGKRWGDLTAAEREEIFSKYLDRTPQKNLSTKDMYFRLQDLSPKQLGIGHVGRPTKEEHKMRELLKQIQSPDTNRQELLNTPKIRALIKSTYRTYRRNRRHKK